MLTSQQKRQQKMMLAMRAMIRKDVAKQTQREKEKKCAS